MPFSEVPGSYMSIKSKHIAVYTKRHQSVLAEVQIALDKIYNHKREVIRKRGN